MKEVKKILLFFALLLITICFSVCVSAEEYEFYFDASDKKEVGLFPEEEMSAFVDGVPESVREEAAYMANAASGANPSESADAVRERLSVRYLTGVLISKIEEILLPTAADCSGLLALIIVSSLLTSFFKLKEGSGMQSVCETVIDLTVSAAVVKVSMGVVEVVGAYVGGLCSMMNAMTPVMGAVYLSSGSLSQAAVNSSAMMLYVTATENLCREFFIPAAKAALALTVVSGAFRHINFGGFVSTVKRWVITVLAFGVTVFSFILGIQSSLAKSADTLAAKTVKFAVGSSVPLVGGAISDALSTVSASLSMIKKVTGGAGVALILTILIPALATLALNKLALTVCKCAADILGCERASAVIGDADSVLSVFTAVAVLSAVMFIFAVTLFMNSGLS